VFATRTLVTATAQTLIQLATPSTRRANVAKISMSFDGITKTDKPVLIELLRQTTTKTASGTAKTPDDPADPTALCSTQTIFTVKPTKTQEQVYRALTVAKEKSAKAIKVGASTHTLDTIARGILKKAGIEEYFTHSLGHGVGLEIHEGVSLSVKSSEAKLLRHEVITIEPGAYFPGKFGMRVEDMYYVG
jgi:Xaa-Pro aminopeptidase